MSQATDWSVPLSGPVAPDVMADRMDKSFDALLSAHSGSSRPTYAVAGTSWISTAEAGKQKFYEYDGTTDHLIKTIDTVTGIITYSGLQDNLPGAWMTGLITSPNATNPNTQIDIGVGSYYGNQKIVINSATITKRLDAVFASGTGNGGLDTGTKANSSTYHIHQLRKQNNGLPDYLFSLSATAPAVPGGHDLIGRIATIKTNGSGNIVAYTQSASKFTNAINVQEATTGTATAKALITLATAPDGISVDMIMQATASNTGGQSQVALSDGNTKLGDTTTALQALVNDAGASASTEIGLVRTNASRQIFAQINVSGGTASMQIYAQGWVDYSLPRLGA